MRGGMWRVVVGGSSVVDTSASFASSSRVNSLCLGLVLSFSILWSLCHCHLAYITDAWYICTMVLITLLS